MVGYAIFSIVLVSLVGWWALSRVLDRLRGIPDVHKLDAPAEVGPVGPVPVALTGARFRYPDADHDALRPLTMTVDAGEHVAITGANGSGKTTLMLLLSGRQPTSGTITRPGGVGLGQLGGTAVVMQHPESQVLGSRVADDVVWGLPPGTRTDVGTLLGEVGLSGMEERDTGGLSGGEPEASQEEADAQEGKQGVHGHRPGAVGRGLLRAAPDRCPAARSGCGTPPGNAPPADRVRRRCARGAALGR
jgi:energy-coupling factor transport system ATP-binding protein